MGRAYDVVLLGATGFTGRLTAHHLAAQLAGTGVSWAIAGRSRDKLAALRAELPDEPAVEVADVTDSDGLADLAGRTRALATTVGPFARHGEPVVQACVRAGAHYADITGEPAFLRVLDRYDDAARRRGVTLVPCCGFDSVPPDLGAQLTAAHLPDDAPIDVRGYVRASGRPSGGTARTALDAVASRQLPRAGAGPPARSVRPVSSLPARAHRARELHAWGVPLPTVDAAIVLRSARTLDGYGAAFRYGHYAHVRHLPAAVAGAAAVGAFVGAASLAPTRALLRRALPRAGEGPSAEARAKAWFTLTFVGVGGGRRVVARVSGGDPGYDATAVMLGEAVRALAADPDRARATAGVATPAVALGEPYRERLAAHGIAFERVSAT